MKTNIPISAYLEIIRDFQKDHPSAHVGGSIGLFLHGIDLKRPITKSDIDMTIDEYEIQQKPEAYQESSDAGDFDLQYRAPVKGGNQLYIKIDLRICPEPSFDKIEYEGLVYNVSKKRDILYWKKKYAKKGHKKHMADLKCIESGIREPEPEPTHVSDDLPF